MPSRTLIDNWSLQTVAELLDRGISPSEASTIELEGGCHEYKAIPEGVVQTEALFDLLTDIVLRDQLIIDSAFAETWEAEESPLDSLGISDVLRRVPFLDSESKFAELRDFFVDRLCITESLRRDHLENVKGWAADEQSPNPYLAAVLWGGAGMVARSEAFDCSYCPHPLRRRLFLTASLFLDGNQAHSTLHSVITEKRLQVAKKMAAGDQLYSMNVCLPPIPIRILEHCSTPSDLVSVALQMRPDFEIVHNWLKETEDLIAADDLTAMRKQFRALDDVSQNIDRLLGKSDGETSLSAGISVLKVSTKISPLAWLRNSRGFRATINALVLSASGKAALQKYCRFFGESGSIVERQLLEHFSVRTRAPTSPA